MTTPAPDIYADYQENIQKDWDWWSDFLQREYYGGPSERSNWERTARDVAKAIGLYPGMRVLDLGSGCGEMVLRLALQGAEAVGVEQSPTLVENCRKAARDRGIAASFIAANMFEFEPDATFDAILSLNTSLGYGDDSQNRALIARIGSWLKPGGVLFLDLVTADNAEEFGVWSDSLANGTFIVDNSYDPEQQMMTSYPAWIAPDHETVFTATSPEVVRIYRRAELEEMMQAAGMEPERLRRTMGRTFKQGDDDMMTTWIARKRAR
jgi:cyclopropane fatty-acyl-phospholipid synthase-like methyltransferase